MKRMIRMAGRIEDVVFALRFFADWFEGMRLSDIPAEELLWLQEYLM